MREFILGILALKEILRKFFRWKGDDTRWKHENVSRNEQQ